MALIIIGGKNDRILFIISPTERMSHPDMRSVCIRDILLEAPCYMTDCRLKISPTVSRFPCLERKEL